MEENTKFLRAILRRDWGTYNDYVEDFARQGKGSPVAIVGCAFHVAIQKHFGSRQDIREVIKFVAEARMFFADGEDVPAREAEGLICATLDFDEPWVDDVIDSLDATAISLIEGKLLFKLVLDENMSDEQLDALLADAERLLREE